MNVPRLVIIGKSPMKTVCSLISPVVALRKRARTNTGAAYVMSFSLHSSTENFGCGRRSTSPGSNSSSRLSWPVKSSIGLMSAKASARPRSRNQRKESRCTETRSGRARTSSRLAKENRSGLLDREGNDVFLPDVGVDKGQQWYSVAGGRRRQHLLHKIGHGPVRRPD